MGQVCIFWLHGEVSSASNTPASFLQSIMPSHLSKLQIFGLTRAFYNTTLLMAHSDIASVFKLSMWEWNKQYLTFKYKVSILSVGNRASFVLQKPSPDPGLLVSAFILRINNSINNISMETVLTCACPDLNCFIFSERAARWYWAEMPRCDGYVYQRNFTLRESAPADRPFGLSLRPKTCEPMNKSSVCSNIILLYIAIIAYC